MCEVGRWGNVMQSFPVHHIPGYLRGGQAALLGLYVSLTLCKELEVCT